MYTVSGLLYSNSDNVSLCCLDYDERSSHTSVIRANYVFLLDTLDVKFSGLVTQLYSEHIVSAVERDDIMAEKTSFRANEKLLSALSHKSPQQFQLFLDALDNCGQQHVSNVIRPDAPQGLLSVDITSIFTQIISSVQCAELHRKGQQCRCLRCSATGVD